MVTVTSVHTCSSCCLSKSSLVDVMGKRLDQEEEFCSLSKKSIDQSGETDTRVSKQILLDVVSRLDNFGMIRFLCLRRLPHGQQEGVIEGLDNAESPAKSSLQDPTAAKVRHPQHVSFRTYII